MGLTKGQRRETKGEGGEVVVVVVESYKWWATRWWVLQREGASVSRGRGGRARQVRVSSYTPDIWQQSLPASPASWIARLRDAHKAPPATTSGALPFGSFGWAALYAATSPSGTMKVGLTPHSANISSTRGTFAARPSRRVEAVVAVVVGGGWWWLVVVAMGSEQTGQALCVAPRTECERSPLEMTAKTKAVSGRASAASRMASNGTRSSWRCSSRLRACLVFLAGGGVPAMAFEPAISKAKALGRFWPLEAEDEEEAIAAGGRFERR